MKHWLALAALICFGSTAYAQGQAKQEVSPTFQQEGRDPIYYSTSCISTAWTLVLSSDTIARSTIVIAISSNTSSVCVSSGPTNANTCVGGTPGDELGPNSSITLNHRAAIYCRSALGTQILKGHRNRDHADYGQPGVP